MDSEEYAMAIVSLKINGFNSVILDSLIEFQDVRSISIVSQYRLKCRKFNLAILRSSYIRREYMKICEVQFPRLAPVRP